MAKFMIVRIGQILEVSLTGLSSKEEIERELGSDEEIVGMFTFQPKRENDMGFEVIEALLGVDETRDAIEEFLSFLANFIDIQKKGGNI